MRYHLIMDADDTLWENNIYFEQAIHSFMTFLDHSRLSREEVRAVLDEIERLMGLEGVKETLAYLSPRHDLFLLTKGDSEEQKLKVERSGIEEYFKEVVIVPEKDVTTYHRIVSELQIDPQSAWMVGNSPRSDINPALAAGLNAVYIPHPHTWHLEHEEVQPAGEGRLLTLSTFAELCTSF